MNLKDIKVEKIALFLLTAFILILFLDYSFDIRIILSKKLNYEIKDISRLRYTIIISIIPILYFIGKTEYDKKPDILSNSILPFMTFLSGIYLLKIEFFKSVDGIVILMVIQLLLSLSILETITIILSKIIKVYIKMNIYLKTILNCTKIDNDCLNTEDIDKIIKGLESNIKLNSNMIKVIKNKTNQKTDEC